MAYKKLYAVIPTAASLSFEPDVDIPVTKGEPPVTLPYRLLEYEFSPAQRTEITALGGIVFENSDEYMNWFEGQ